MSIFLSKVLVSLAQLFINSLPQNLAYIIGIYAFNKKKIDGRNFWSVMVISLASIFMIRLLPINIGVHTILGMVVFILLGVYFWQIVK
ncbi:MAG: hypothetical protein PHV07_06040 [Oscillospiraceae bacterium]|nr:hypothetical protein [Oscillospiraceae bacterium]